MSVDIYRRDVLQPHGKYDVKKRRFEFPAEIFRQVDFQADGKSRGARSSIHAVFRAIGGLGCADGKFLHCQAI